MRVKIGDFLKPVRSSTTIQSDVDYKQVTVRMNNQGVCLRGIKKGSEIKTKKQFLVEPGQFILSKIDARNGAFGLVPNDLDGAIVTQDFPTYSINHEIIDKDYLLLINRTELFLELMRKSSSGTTNRKRLKEEKFLNIEIDLPKPDVQHKITSNHKLFQNKLSKINFSINNLEKLLPLIYQHIENTRAPHRGALGRYIENKTEVIGNLYRGKRKIGVSNENGITELRTMKDTDLERYKVVDKKSFIYNPMRINVGSIGLYEGNESAITSPDYVVFRTIKYPENYLLHFLKSPKGISEIRTNTKGSVRERLYFSNLSNINVPQFDQNDYESLNQLFDSISHMTRLIKELKSQKTLIENQSISFLLQKGVK